jgi:hypothetical protein
MLGRDRKKRLFGNYADRREQCRNTQHIEQDEQRYRKAKALLSPARGVVENLLFSHERSSLALFCLT